MNDAVTREEMLLNAIATGETPDIKPITRREKYLRYLAGIGEKPKKPITREEMFLDLIQAGGGGDIKTEIIEIVPASDITNNNPLQVNHNLGKIPDFVFIFKEDYDYTVTLTAYEVVMGCIAKSYYGENVSYVGGVIYPSKNGTISGADVVFSTAYVDGKIEDWHFVNEKFPVTRLNTTRFFVTGQNNNRSRKLIAGGKYKIIVGVY